MEIERMRRTALLVLAVAAGILATAVLCAATTVQVKLTGVNGVAKDDVSVDPYYGTINGNPATLVCDDFDHETYIGESWTATVSTLSDLSSVRFQQGTPAETLQAYEEAGFLYNELLANPSQYADISFALWALFTPSVTHLSGFTSTSQWWLNDAENQTFYAGEFSNLEILTPTNPQGDSPQEFLSETPVPEPATVVLLMSCLVGLAFIARKKARQLA